MTLDYGPDTPSNWVLLPQQCAINEICKPMGFKNEIQCSIGSSREFVKLSNCTLISDTSGPLGKLSELNSQIFDFALLLYRQQGEDQPFYVSTLSDFMHLRRLRDKGTARHQIQAFINCLYHISIQIRGQNGFETTFRILSENTKLNSRGDMVIRFTPQFKGLLKHATPMEYHTALLMLNTKQWPGAYSVARKMLERLRFRTSNEECLSVRSLLKCMAIDPSNDAIRTNFKARVRIRLEKTLNILSDVVSWHYSRAKRIPLLKPIKEISNLEFLTLYVVFKRKNSHESPTKEKVVLLTSEPPAVDGARVSC